MSNNIFRKSSLDRMSSPEHLNDYIKVSSPSVWIVIVAMFILLAGFGVWSYTGSMPTTVNCNGVSTKSNSSDDMVDTVVCYIQQENFQKISAAINSSDSVIKARVTPKDTDKYGYISGTINRDNVGTKISSAEDVRETIGDTAIASALLPSGFGVYVEINLDHDLAHPKELKWEKNNQDGSANLLSSTICDVVIVTREEQPLSFLLG